MTAGNTPPQTTPECPRTSSIANAEVAESKDTPDPEASASASKLAISQDIEDAYAKVSEIGKGWHWYDLPYRVMFWFLTGWRRKIAPRKVRSLLNFGVNYLLAFHQHDLDKVWNRNASMHSFALPADEHVSVPSVWVLELFPPSQFASLESAIRKNDWDRERRLWSNREANLEILVKSRSGTGWSWWSLGEIVDTSSRWQFPDGTREKLPDLFEAIQLRAIQIGTGLTAVAGRFYLSESSAAYLDTVWHSDHEPMMLRRHGGRPQTLNHKWAAFHNTQTARCQVHEAARKWMQRRIPGFFASIGEANTLVDMLLTDKFDPLESGEPPRELDDAFRALGLTEHHMFQYVSKDLPGFRLMSTSTHIAPAIGSGRVWALWAQRQRAADATERDLSPYGANVGQALAHRYSDGIESFLIPLGISDYLEATEAQYAVIRDHARAQHGRFKSGAIRSLRQSLLTFSLDVASVFRDLKADWDSRPDFRDEVEFTREITAAARSRGITEKDFGPLHVNADLRERQTADFDRLIDADHDYRDILSTVASLGASADASKLGRIALWVALGSLAVAVLTLLLTQTAHGSLIDWLVSAFKTLSEHGCSPGRSCR